MGNEDSGEINFRDIDDKFESGDIEIQKLGNYLIGTSVVVITVGVSIGLAGVETIGKLTTLAGAAGVCIGGIVHYLSRE